jgi:arsenate reductase
MAEGWARYLKGGAIEAYSAGIEAHGQNPRAIQVMEEAGVDISSQSSKRMDELLDVEFDYVITVCDHANEHCPVFPGRCEVVHANFDDPAKAEGTEEEIMKTFRRVRDEIREFVERLPEAIRHAGRPGQPEYSLRTPRNDLEEGMDQ